MQNKNSSSNWRQTNFNNDNGNETQSATSSQHQTPRRNRREFLNNKNVSSPYLSGNYPNVTKTENRFNRNDYQNQKERIYEEPESPVCCYFFKKNKLLILLY